jgi:hypothetical protein
MSKFDPERESHKAWLGLVQPVGLVVSPPALIKAQVVLDKNVIPLQQALLGVVVQPASVHGDADPVLLDFPRFAFEVLGWAPEDLAGAPGGPRLPDALAVALPDYGETLRPTFAVVDGMAEGKTLLLVQVVGCGLSLDKVPSPTDNAHAGWNASPQARFERLLRDTGVSAGLLLNGAELRLVHAPRGESSGHMGFPVAEMCTVGGRPLLAAVHMLLSEHRVFGAPDKQRLLDLLVESRKYQSEVSNRLAEQVLGALWELLRGFQAADEAANGRVLFDLPQTEPQEIYGGLLTVIMRLVFLLYAEDQGLMPDDPVYARNYAIGGLFERLREDAGRHPDTMDQRFGAYAWLLSTFRMVYDGGAHGGFRLPTRHGQLFNPDDYAFLEGRPAGVGRVVGDVFEAPRVSDGTIWHVLSGLLMLDGERLSYRALDVEQIGSVYESMMGFDVRTLPGRALAVRPKNVVFDVDALLGVAANRRAAWLKEQTECDLAAGGVSALSTAKTVDDVVAALGRKVAPQTPRALAPGALFLQPGEERRRSGSHYTPRELTEPIVRTTLRPVLEALGARPTPDQILDLKVCDPAMGSGAFLVEACRQLAAALVSAWEVDDSTPKLPADEDPLLHARRLVAQRCLYGVDKNPFAVNLAKLSLWLVTLAKDHAFTFLDHALKHGDSLVGLTKAQIGAFHWGAAETGFGPLLAGVSASTSAAGVWREKMHALGEGEYDARRIAWNEAEDALHDVRLIGDLCIAAYFGKEKDKDREGLRRVYRGMVDAWKAGGGPGEIAEVVVALRGGERPVLPFHWEIEFPEVFGRENAGFDAMVGNPPFLGGASITANYGRAMLAWILHRNTESHGNADLVAHFYRLAFQLIRCRGAFGLIATNTIAQGDTRASGLRWIATHGGEIYAATRRVKWPGLAAVVVSVAHVWRGHWNASRRLDGRDVSFVSAFLFHGGGHCDPHRLVANAGKSFRGSVIYGKGFTFDDTDTSGACSPIAEMHRLIAKDVRNAERIFPYVGGEEVNTSPTHGHHRYVINFEQFGLDLAEAWPDLISIVRERVKPERDLLREDTGPGAHGKKWWWQFQHPREPLYTAIRGLNRVLVNSQVSTRVQFAFLPDNMVYGHTANVFPLSTLAAFASLQSRSHEIWARFFGSSMKDDLRYTPSDCFETFPFPPNWQTSPTLESAGQTYYDFRAALMIRNNEGLTKTYNRFHDPNERSPDILHLRELHGAMDRAVLDAYGWTDIATDCDFFLDYEIDEETWGDKKKPFRYRWPDAVRDDVLARLLDLNQQRHQEELAAGLHGKLDKTAPAAAKKPPAKKRARPNATLSLFPGEDEGET